jgi:NO-binding membrane sensor protein with MHYT domain
VVLAMVIAFVALLLTFRFREEMESTSWGKVLSALVMGAAVPVMHYTGMAAASFPLSHITQSVKRKNERESCWWKTTP